MHKFKGIIFDLDGTIFDSCSMWHKIDEIFLNKRGFEVPEDYSKAIAPLGLRKAADYTIERFKLNEKAEDIIKEWHDLAVYEYTYNVNLKPYVSDYLKKLKTEGVKLAIATANDEEFYIPCLKRNNILQYFDHICDVNAFKGSKNSPEIYLRVAKTLNMSPSDMAVFEDIPQALKSAHDGGFYTVAVDDITEANIKEEKKNISDLFIESFGELL
ncbi:MAG: HAD family phosphatase [Acholeplasmatales bacterium]|nr:HAD family phosphatase [Acholeplasmatales bacterium]